jgi:3-oxoacyl-[acyl-carrier-protein] synthase-3
MLRQGCHLNRTMPRRAHIMATGGYVPRRVVSNEELAALTGVNAASMRRRTGIVERRWAAPEEATADLAMQAATLALHRAKESPDAIDGIIVSTTSPDMPLPSSACHVQRLLGAGRAFAFDLAASCSGFLYALSIGNEYIRTGAARRILIVAAEVKSRFLDFRDPQTAILFGDGAGAVLLGPATDDRGISSVTLGADGTFADLISIRAGGSRLPSSLKTVTEGLHAITMQGPTLFRRAVRRLESAVRETLESHDLHMSDVRWFLFHQANGRLLEKVHARLGISAEQTISVIQQYGNTSSSSLPLTLDAGARTGQFHNGDLILLATIGSGLTWGTALIRW